MSKLYFLDFKYKKKKKKKIGETAESMASEARIAVNCPWASGLENARQGVLSPAQRSCHCQLPEFSSL